MNEKIRDVDKMAEEVLRDRELWDTINDKIMEKNLYNLKMQYAREQGEENGRKDTKTEIAKKIRKTNRRNYRTYGINQRRNRKIVKKFFKYFT